jgi:hypothetical protein
LTVNKLPYQAYVVTLAAASFLCMALTVLSVSASLFTVMILDSGPIKRENIRSESVALLGLLYTLPLCCFVAVGAAWTLFYFKQYIISLSAFVLPLVHLASLVWMMNR